jgi:Protein of unknown function (DUF3500)
VNLNTDGASPGGANTAAVATAVNAFLATLDDSKRDAVEYDFTDNQARQTWSNFPSTTVPREGPALSDLTAEQQQAPLALVDYHIAIYGQPSATQPFMVQFGGHHLSRTLTYNGDKVSQTPQFVGTEPTSFTTDGPPADTGVQAGGVNHIHTVYRDGSYGRGF